MNAHTTIQFEPGQKLTCKIESLGFGGEGIAKPDGFTVFIPRTAPGDLVEIELIEIKKRHATAKLLEIKVPSPLRRTPECEYYNICGGCHYQHIDYEQTRFTKRKQTQDTLERIAKEKDHVVHDVFSPTNLFHYRNKLTYHIDKTSKKMGYVSLARKGLSDIDTCTIAPADLNELWKEVRSILQKSDILPKYVVLRKTTTDQLAIILSMTDKDWNKNTQTAIEELFRPLLTKSFLYVSVIPEDHFNPFDKMFISIHGPQYLTEKLQDIHYLIQPFSFFQINHEVASKMIEFALSWTQTEKAKSLLDLYCGAGLFSLALAKHSGCLVTGVEISYTSILAAQETGKAQELSGSAKFRTGRATTITEKLFRENARFDSCIVDPPRKGLEIEVIQNLTKLGIKKLLYVSCSPPTFARDVIALKSQGFLLKEVRPFDMFPQTYHVELMATFRLSRP